MDIQSPIFAEKITNLLILVKQDDKLKSALLTNPEQFLAQYDIVLNEYRVLVEDREGYGLFFAVEPKKAALPESKEKNLPDSFDDLHFLDCLHY